MKIISSPLKAAITPKVILYKYAMHDKPAIHLAVAFKECIHYTCVFLELMATITGTAALLKFDYTIMGNFLCDVGVYNEFSVYGVYNLNLLTTNF